MLAQELKVRQTNLSNGTKEPVKLDLKHELKRCSYWYDISETGYPELEEYKPSEFLIRLTNTFSAETIPFKKEDIKKELETNGTIRPAAIIVTCFVYDVYQRRDNLESLSELNGIYDIMEEALTKHYDEDNKYLDVYKLQLGKLELDGIEHFTIRDLTIILTELFGLPRALVLVNLLAKSLLDRD